MKTIILSLTVFLTSCFATTAQEPKKILANAQSGSFRCFSIGIIESCGARLYDCFDGSGRRFDVVCATNVTIDK